MLPAELMTIGFVRACRATAKALGVSDAENLPLTLEANFQITKLCKNFYIEIRHDKLVRDWEELGEYLWKFLKAKEELLARSTVLEYQVTFLDTSQNWVPMKMGTEIGFTKLILGGGTSDESSSGKLKQVTKRNGG